MFQEILPNGKVLNQNSTHVAIKAEETIDIYIKGFLDTEDGFQIQASKLYSIAAKNEDDLFAIFERLDEDNRVNVAEANGEFI